MKGKKEILYETQCNDLFVEEDVDFNFTSEKVQRNFSIERKENESIYTYNKRMEALEWFTEELLKGRRSGEEEGWIPAEEVRKMFSADRTEK